MPVTPYKLVCSEMTCVSAAKWTVFFKRFYVQVVSLKKYINFFGIEKPG